MENKNFSFITEDDHPVQVSKQIANVSKLFHNIIQDYEHESESKDKKLEGITFKYFKLLINFCESISYNNSIIRINKPFDLISSDEINKMFENNKNLKIMFDDLNEINIVDYAHIADFFDVNILENIIHLKLHQVFSSQESIKAFFQKLNNSDSNDILDIDEAREKYLRDKYMIYAEKYVNNLTDEQVNDLLD